MSIKTIEAAYGVCVLRDVRIVMQLSFLDQDYALHQEYNRALEQFDCESAVRTLSRWRQTFAPPDLAAREDALGKMRAILDRVAQDDCRAMLDAMRDLPSHASLSALAQDMPAIRRGFLRKVAALCDERRLCDYIAPQWHPAEIYIGLQEHDKAIDAVRQSIMKSGEDPLLRQMQSYAFFQKKWDRDGYRCLCYALFNNPLQCLEKFPLLGTSLLHDDARDMLIALRERHDDAELIWVHLPFELWRENKIRIEDHPPEFERFIRELAAHDDRSDARPSAKAVRFLHLLYLAETARLRGEVPDAAIRRRMKDLNGELFKSYMDVVRSEEG